MIEPVPPIARVEAELYRRPAIESAEQGPTPVGFALKAASVWRLHHVVGRAGRLRHCRRRSLNPFPQRAFVKAVIQSSARSHWPLGQCLSTAVGCDDPEDLRRAI